MRRICC
jgi:hypothetical protein